MFVVEPGGATRIFGYPEAVFPPTDFHTATLLWDSLYVVGGLGYAGGRVYGSTPVFRLDLATFRIERIETRGEMPGWIHRHRATGTSDHGIRVVGGTIVTKSETSEVSNENLSTYTLDLRTLTWQRG